MLEMIEGDVLGTRDIEELLAMVDQGTSENIGSQTATVCVARF